MPPAAAHPRAGSCRPRGFTLMELLVTLAIAGLLFGLAIPAFTAMLARNRVQASTHALSTSLAQARLHAVLHNTRVVVCPSSDAASCRGSGDWTAGWIVFADRDGNERPERAGDVLGVGQALAAPVAARTSGGRRAVVFHPDGRSPGTNLTLTVCDPAHPDFARSLVISNSGRVRRGATADAHRRCALWP